jgi:hypothetical protein
MRSPVQAALPLWQRWGPSWSDVAVFAACFAAGRQLGQAAALRTVDGPSMLPLFRPGDVLLGVSLPVAAACGGVGAAGRGSWLEGRVVCAALRHDFTVCKRCVACGTDVFGDAVARLEGDNAAESQDSRSYGAVPMPVLEHVIVAVVWPPSRAALVRRRC